MAELGDCLIRKTQLFLCGALAGDLSGDGTWFISVFAGLGVGGVNLIISIFPVGSSFLKLLHNLPQILGETSVVGGTSQIFNSLGSLG